MSDLFLLTNKQVIDLFEIKLNDFEGYFRFHGSKNFDKDLVFKGVTYFYIPSEISNLKYDSDGKQNRPTFSISNANNFIGNLLVGRNDLLGRKFFKKKLLAKDLDAVNFGGVSKNPLGQSAFRDFIQVDTFVIHKKNYENKEKVEFELANVLDIDGMTCPKRKVFNDSCQWQYRGAGCNYGKIAGFEGPLSLEKTSLYSTLEQVISAFSSSNLGASVSLWLHDVGNKATQSGTSQISLLDYRIFDKAVKGKYAIWKMTDQKFFNFKKLTDWANSAGDVNTTNTSIIISDSDISLTGETKLQSRSVTYSSINKRFNSTTNAKTAGALFFPEDSLNITKNFQNLSKTIFFVGCFSKFLRIVEDYDSFTQKSILTSLTGDLYLGFKNGSKNYYSIGSSNVLSEGLAASFNDAGQVGIFCITLPYDAGDQVSVSVYFNGRKTHTKDGVTSTDFNGLGINLLNGQKSNCALHELIVFEKILQEQEIVGVTSYLANKHGVKNVSQDLFSEEQKLSQTYFTEQEGNLGIPVADDDDKTFLYNSSDTSGGKSYDLKQIQYKGDYSDKQEYVNGDFVKLDQNINFDFDQDFDKQNNEIPSRFFVYVGEQPSQGIHPLSNSKLWIEDKCSKKLSGCLKRFKDTSSDNSNINIPFGGFPGTVTYDYKLPES